MDFIVDIPTKTSGMNFNQALRAMKEGNRVERNRWKTGCPLYLEDGHIKASDGHIIKMKVETLEATDWRIYVKPQTLIDKAQGTMMLGFGNEMLSDDRGLLVKDVEEHLNKFIKQVSEELTNNQIKIIKEIAKEIFGAELLKEDIKNDR